MGISTRIEYICGVGLCIVLVAAALARMMMTYVQDHPVKTSPTISCTTTRVEKVGVHDLIIGEPHQKVEFSYDITNPTDSSLTFDKPRLFCACALTVTPKTVLEPGESTRLAFSLQAPMAGTRRETLVLPYDNGAIVIRVAVAADVAPPTVTQTPGLVSLDLVRGAVTKRPLVFAAVELRIPSDDSAPRLLCAVPGLEFTVDRIDDEPTHDPEQVLRTYRCRITADGSYSELKSNKPVIVFHDRQVPIGVTVKDPIAIVPPEIHLSAERPIARFSFIGRDGRALEIEVADGTSEFFNVRLEPKSDTVVEALVELRGSSQLSSAAALNFTTTHPLLPTVSVAVRQ